MLRVLVSVLVLVGLLLFVAGLATGNSGLVILGLLITGGALFWAFRPGGILRKESVLDNWSVLIESGQSHAPQIFDWTRGFLKDSDVSDVQADQRELSPGLFRGMLGHTRSFLVFTEIDNSHLHAYQLFMNARDYGSNLDVSWYLTFRPSFLEALIRLLPFVPVGGPQNLDLFDQQDLRAYATNAHHCLLRAVEKLLLELGQDKERLERHSRGFLGIS